MTWYVKYRGSKIIFELVMEKYDLVLSLYKEEADDIY